MKNILKTILLVVMSIVMALTSLACDVPAGNNGGNNGGQQGSQQGGGQQGGQQGGEQGGEEEQPFEVLGFPSTIQENVLQGEIYTITMKSVKDNRGKTYFTKYVVKTKSGGDVQVFGGQFDIEDANGYIITYTITLADNTTMTCVATLNCVKDGAITIELPTNVPTATAGVAYTIPTAKLIENGNQSSTVPTMTASFVANYTYQKQDNISLTNFVPTSSGKITVTYSSPGASAQNLEITVNPKTPSQNHALDFSNSDVIGAMQKGTNNVTANKLDYVTSGNESYVKWYNTDNSKASWQMLKVQSMVDNTVLDNYTHVRVKMRAISDTGTYRWRALMCSDGYITGPDGAIAGAYTSSDRLDLNAWNDVFIPISVFKASGNGFDKKCFISVTFNSPSDGNADNVKEVHFTDFELINFTFAASKSTYSAGENPTFTASGSLGKNYSVEIRQGDTLIDTLTANGNTFTWNNATSLTGAFKACVIVENKVFATATFGIGIEPVTIFTPSATTYTKFTYTDSWNGNSVAGAVTHKTGANGGYSGDFVSITVTSAVTANKWINIYYDRSANLDFSKYNNIEIWVYPQSRNTGTVAVPFFDDANYKPTLTANQWNKVVLDAKVFTEKMGRTTSKSSGAPYKNWLCSISLNYNTLYGIYFGTITATV